MSIIVIPNKICPHCGGNKWYSSFIKNKLYYRCYEIVKLSIKKYRSSIKGSLNTIKYKKQKNNLFNSYVRNIISVSNKQTGLKSDFSSFHTNANACFFKVTHN